MNLILQCLTPALIFQDYERIKLRVAGGTLTEKQPTVGSILQLIALLSEMGINMTYDVRKHGIFPCIVGQVETVISPVPNGQCLKAIDLTSESRLKGAEPKPIIDLLIYTTKGNAQEFYESRFAK